MRWYSKELSIEGFDVVVEGTFTDSVLKITASYDDKTIKFFEKPVQMWAHQEILAEDIYRKYQGKIQKIENKQLPLKLKAERTSGV
jgi:hypothetical protein